MFKWIKDGLGAVTATLFGKKKQVFTFDRTNPDYDILIEAMKNDDQETFIHTINKGKLAEDWSVGHFSTKKGYLEYDGKKINPVIQDKIFEMVKAGEDYRPILRFLHKTYQNREGLYPQELEDRISNLWLFLKNNNMPIIENGDFLGYKGVAEADEDFVDKMGLEVKWGDFVDCHTRMSYRNNPGDSPRMRLSQINRKQEICAGAGLHVGNHSYCTFGERSVLVSVNPADVIVCPRETHKVRTLGYTVLREVPQDFPEVLDLVYYFEDQDLVPAVSDEDIDFEATLTKTFLEDRNDN